MKKMMSALLVASMLAIMLPFTVSAYTGGELSGKTFYHGADQSDTLATSNLLTDGSETTSVKLDVNGGAKDVVWYEFTAPLMIGAYQLKSSSASVVVKFYNASGVQIYTDESNPTYTTQNGQKRYITPVRDVKKIAVMNLHATIINDVFEFDVFSTEDYSGGILDGLAMNRGTSTTNSGGTNFFVTDNNDETFGTISLHVSANEWVWWTNLSKDFNVNSYRFKGIGPLSNMRIRLYAATNYTTPVVDITPTNSDGSEVLITGANNIRKVSIQNIGTTASTNNIYEFNVYGTEAGVPDTTAPPVPTGLQATANNGSTVISWNPVSAPDLAGYFVFVDGEKVTPTPITATSYTAAGLSNNASHTFQVTSVDNIGNESVKSETISTLFDTVSPLAPIGLVSNPGTAGQTLLTWQRAPESDLAGYNVYEAATKKNGPLVTDNSYLVTGLAPNVSYSFTVTAVDTSANESPKSGSVTYLLDTAAPSKPTGLTATVNGGNVTLNWTAPADADVQGFNVYRDALKVNPAIVTGTTYTDTGVAPGTYQYTVEAVDAYNNASPRSSAASATLTTPTPPPPPGSLEDVILHGSWGFGASDIWTNTATVVASLGVFVLLGIIVHFTPQIIEIIRAAIVKNRRGGA